MTSYTLLTQNCFGLPLPGKSKRLKTLASYIKKHQPDIVLLQEIIFRHDVKYFQISGYSVIYYPMGIFIRGGLVILSKEAPSSTVFETYKKQGSKYTLQLTDRLIKKGILAIYIKSLSVYVINTHLVSTYGKGADNDLAIAKQIKQLLSYTKKIKERLILGGDFNIKPSSMQYERLTQKLYDVTASVGSSHAWGIKWDYIFTRGFQKDWKIHEVSYDRFVSHHKGLLVTVNSP